LKENVLTTRREKEKKSMSQLRNDFQQYLSESEKQLLEHISNLSTEHSDHLKKIDEFKSEKNDLFDSWYKNVTSEFETFNNQAI
jgi:ElaB/YqjD/DUF883 family membrane-anchored ribosome-binding protein